MGGALTSEIRKIFTTKLWWGMALGMAVVSAGLSAMMGLLVGLASPDGASTGFEVMTTGVAQIVYNAGLLGSFGSLSALFPLALGVLLITTEFRHKTVTATYLATPKRGVVAVAKVIAVVLVGAVLGLVHVVSATAGGGAVLAAKGHDLYLGDGDVLRSLGIAVVATIVWTLIGFGFGMLVRNQIAAVLIAVGFAFLGQLILNIAFAVLGWNEPMKYIPGNLTTGMLVSADPSAAEGGPSGGESPFFSWWVSALILTGYAMVLTVIGSILTARKDIT